jgi:xanthine dehydrogenase accessory factor
MRDLIIVRGGGDIATGTIFTLRKAGFAVLILECGRPSAIRRCVSFSEAVYEGSTKVEDTECVRAGSAEEAVRCLEKGGLPVLIDPEAGSVSLFQKGGEYAGKFRLVALVDAVLAKKNLGTKREMAPFVIALGPGFTAGSDCDAVIETMRGHDLGRVIRNGQALPNTGTPGLIAGHAADRVIHAECSGILYDAAKIGDYVEKDSTIAVITDPQGKKHEVRAPFAGLVRGLIRDSFPVTTGFKIADIDPRKTEYKNCFTISDKARCIGGAVLMSVMEFLSEEKEKA